MTYWLPSVAADLAALRADVEPLQTLAHTGASVSTLTINQLGNAKAIRIITRWVKSAALDLRLFLAPNGLTNDQLTDYTQGDGGGGAGDLSFARLLMALGDRGTIAHSVTYLILSTGQIRTLSVVGGCGSLADSAQTRNFQGYGRWLDTSTAITSIQVQCRDAVGLVADIADGTDIRVFKVY